MVVLRRFAASTEDRLVNSERGRAVWQAKLTMAAVIALFVVQLRYVMIAEEPYPAI